MESKDTNNFTQEEFDKKYQEEYASFDQQMGKCNAMVLGLTGVGKSTLINAVFGFSTAKTGIGRPITDGIREYSDPNSPINIYDTPGLEVDQEKIKHTKEAVSNLITEKLALEPKKHIHFVWYCINDKSSRIQDAEKEWIEDIVKQEVPVIIVLTQTYEAEDSELFDYIKKLNLPVHNIIPVLAEPLKIGRKVVQEQYGLKNLIKVTLDSFPQQAEKANATSEAINAARRAFIAAQKVDVDSKISEAKLYLKGYAAGATVAGSPLSGVFGGFLVAGIQTGMIAHITSICGLEFNRFFLWPIYGAFAYISVPTLVAVSIPGLDYVGAPVAGVITYLLGNAFLFGYEQYLNHTIEKEALGKTIINTYKRMLQEGLKERYD
jgi:predicted GTPase